MIPSSRIVAVAVVLALSVLPLRAQAGTLHDFEKKAAEKAQPATNDVPTPSCHDHDEKSFHRDRAVEEFVGAPFQELFGEILVGVFLAPVWMPYMALERPETSRLKLPLYPFRAEETGFGVEKGRSWGVRASGSTQWAGPRLQGYRTDLAVSITPRWSVEGSWSRYVERGADSTDPLTLWEVLPTYTFAQNDHWRFRAGAGYQRFNGWGDPDRLKMLYGLRYFQNHTQLAFDAGVSNFGGKPIWELAPSLSIHVNRFEIRAGYRRLNVSDVVIQGPELGLAVWF